MSHSHLEPPRSLIAALWSITGLVAVFIAVGFSSIFVLRYFYPVSASIIATPQNGQCPEDSSQIAVNNFPGTDAITKYIHETGNNKTAKVLEPLGGENFRCSMICVPGASGSLATTTEDKQTTSNFLESAKIDGKSLVIVKDGDEFMQKVLEWQKADASKKPDLADKLTRTVITTSTKINCAGPNSVGYGKEFTTADGSKITTAKENTVAEDTKKAAETQKAEQQPSEEKPAAPPELPQPIAGAAKNEVNAPVSTAKSAQWKCLNNADSGAPTEWTWFYKTKGGWKSTGKEYAYLRDDIVNTYTESQNPTTDCGPQPTDIPEDAILAASSTDQKLVACMRKINDFLGNRKKDKGIINEYSSIEQAYIDLKKIDDSTKTQSLCDSILKRVNTYLKQTAAAEENARILAVAAKGGLRFSQQTDPGCKWQYYTKDGRATLYWGIDGIKVWQVRCIDPNKTTIAEASWIPKSTISTGVGSFGFWSMKYKGKYYFQPIGYSWGIYDTKIASSRLKDFDSTKKETPSSLPTGLPDISGSATANATGQQSAQSARQASGQQTCTWGGNLYRASAWIGIGNGGVTLYRVNCFNNQGKKVTSASWIPKSKVSQASGYWSINYNGKWYWQPPGYGWGNCTLSDTIKRLEGYFKPVSTQDFTKYDYPPSYPVGLPI